ncbi:MAG: hypothetical protein WDO74_23460 [Pseudomonadota bacterium]
MSIEAFSAHNANALELEQAAAKRAEIKQKLDEGAQYIADRAAKRKRQAEQEAERRRNAKLAANRRKENAAVSAYLAINSWRMTPAQAIR